MTTSGVILYGGYGANRNKDMLAAITGNQNLKPIPAIFQDIELGIQRYDQISTIRIETAPAPFSPKELITKSWGNNDRFETYVIRRKEGSRVSGNVFELTKLERELIAEWELVEFGWYNRMTVFATLEDGMVIEVVTEGFVEDQNIDRIVNGLDYPTFLNKKENMLTAANKVRLDYLKLNKHI